jgi:aryl-alcohol dehydrogenase-like predicted oxidoreductase
MVSAMGLGGYSLADAPTLDEAKRIVAEAIDAGINFFDNAWEYHDGRSEEWLGAALEGKRDQVFLMTKVCTHGRDKNVAMEQLNDSLRRLKTDHLDLWQVHECVYFNDPDLHFAPGGVIEALDEAKKAGKVRFVGFTGHKHPEIHLKMLSHDYPFDTVQMPLNCFDYTYRSFEQQVLPEANRRQMGVLGMKSLCGGGQPVFDMPVTPQEAISYAMSLPVSTTICGVDSMAVLRQNLAIARGFKPLSDDQMNQLRERCREAAGDGHLEMYKSTKKFDAAVGRKQHGYPPAEKLPL